MVLWRHVLRQLVGFGLFTSGLVEILFGPLGIGGLVGGGLLILSGLAMVTRENIPKVFDSNTEVDLSAVGTTAVVVLLVMGVVAGGALSHSAPVDSVTPDAPESPSAATVTTAAEATTATTTPTSTPDGQPTAWNGTVVEVTDGDTMDVRLPNGSRETVRLLGVDTPETSLSRVSPAEWETIPETADGRDWLVNWGGNATDFATQQLAGQEVYIQTDPEADRRGYYGRLLVYISQSEDAETSFNKRLL